MSNKPTQTIVPKLRFPRFRNTPEWKEQPLEKFLDYQRPASYLVSDTKYSDAYETPVLTAGKIFILGYTNEKDGIFKDNLPVIIFDDFTTATQFVDFPFKVKSSAMKILHAKNGANIKFMYEAMQMISYEVGSHERHWISKFASMLVPIPVDLKEQQKIADCLSSMDDLITAQSKKIKLLQDHKKGLMQQLFPAEGKALPNLRFPEFRNAPEWKEVFLEDLGDIVSGLTYSSEDVRDQGLLVLRSPNIVDGSIKLEDCVYVREDISGVNYSKHEDILICVNNGSKNLLGKSAIIPKDMPICTHGAFMTVFRANNPAFAFQIFQTYAYRLQVSADLGTTIHSITSSKLKKYRFFVPHPKEQQKIADCLSSMDDLITAQSKKIKLLQDHKKGLMQQLFPQSDEEVMR